MTPVLAHRAELVQEPNASAAVHPRGGLLEGQIFHTAGPSVDGWTIMMVHDFKESWVVYNMQSSYLVEAA
jgi:hypothetical protein